MRRLPAIALQQKYALTNLLAQWKEAKENAECRTTNIES
jgi:hypothetical protein